MFADNVVLCGGNDIAMTEYLESYSKPFRRPQMMGKA